VVDGPYHPAFGQLVQSACFLEALRSALRHRPILKETLELRVHPRSISNARGQRNANCTALRREFGFAAVRVAPDPNLDEEVIALPEGNLIGVYSPGVVNG
jgi:hypothetical protein